MSTFLMYASALVLGFFGGLFLYWRRLKEDYKSEDIFSSGTVIFSSTFIFGFLSSLALPMLKLNVSRNILNTKELWFWVATLGFVLAFFFTNRKKHFKFFEQLDASMMAIFIFVPLISLVHFLNFNAVSSLYLFLFSIFIYLIFYISEKNYRKYTWYKSGKVGFSSLVSLGFFFLVRTILSLFAVSMITLSGRIEFILSGVASFLLFFMVYHLSEK